MKRKALLILSLIATIALTAQQTRVKFTLHMKNGDVISGYTSIKSIDFATRYGVMRFPVTDLNTIELGIKDNNVNKMDVFAQLDALHFADSAGVNTMFDSLSALPEGAIPAIKEYVSSPNYKPNVTTQLNVTTLYQVLLAKYQLDQQFAVDDVVRFKDDHSMVGNYNFLNIPLESPYGNLEVERQRIKLIEVVAEEVGNGNIKNFKVEAVNHIAGNEQTGWLNTGMLVKEGGYLEISANGSVVLASLSSNTYTPDGGVNGSPGMESDKLSFGQLVYRIGEKGEVRKAGDDLGVTAAETGILYLSIYESVFSENNSGHYNVRVKVVD